MHTNSFCRNIYAQIYLKEISLFILYFIISQLVYAFMHTHLYAEIFFLIFVIYMSLSLSFYSLSLSLSLSTLHENFQLPGKKIIYKRQKALLFSLEFQEKYLPFV